MILSSLIISAETWGLKEQSEPITDKCSFQVSTEVLQKVFVEDLQLLLSAEHLAIWLILHFNKMRAVGLLLSLTFFCNVLTIVNNKELNVNMWQLKKILQIECKNEKSAL